MNSPLTPFCLFGLLVFFSFEAVGQCTVTFSPTSPCPGEPVTFTVTDPMAGSSYAWDFNADGTTDANGTTVTTTFPFNTAQTTKTVKLKKDGVDCFQQTITVKASPDVSIGLAATQSSNGTSISTTGDTIKTCNLGSPNSIVAIFNASSTQASNSTYELNWGDGSPVQNLTNATFSGSMFVSHNYATYGYKTITLKVTGANGCSRTRAYTYYSGGNPSVGLANPGNTVGLCAPATLTFPISQVSGNPPGTVYTISVNGEVVQTYTQANVPNSYTHLFTESSCMEETTSGLYDHSFDIRIVAENPCNSSASTVEPIQISTPPQADFTVAEPAHKCPEEIWTFTDASTDINDVLGNPVTCDTSLLPDWTITPGTNGNQWSLVSGSLFATDQIKVKFHAPGTYTIQMTIVSVACGLSTISKTITVLEPPTADADALFSPGFNGCVPATVKLDNASTGYQISYNWVVQPQAGAPANGWTFANGTGATSENPCITFVSAGKYKIKLTTTNICDDDTWDTTITFFAKPVIVLDSIPPSCLTATLSFPASEVLFNDNGTPITSYLWQFPGGDPASSTLKNPSNIFYANPGTYTVSVTAMNLCGSTTVSRTFEVQAPVIASAGADFSICQNSPQVTLTGSPPGGVWSGSGVTAQGVLTPSSLGQKVLTYTYGSGVCTSSDQVTVTVNPLPTVDAGANLSACVSVVSTALTGGSPAGGTWAASAGGMLSGNNFLPSASGVGTFTLTYTFVDNNGCSKSDNLQFTVHPLPNVTVADTTYCNTPGLVNLPFATPPGGTWSGQGVSGNQFDPQGAGGVGNHQATYTFTNNNGCTRSKTINIGVVNPAAVAAGPDTSFCASVTSYNLNQFASPTPGTWVGASVSPNGIFNPSQAGAGTHKLKFSVGTGNCKVTDSLFITVHALPVANAGVDQSACVDVASVALSGSPAGGIWTVSAGGVLNGNAFEPANSGAGSYQLTYAVTNAQGCSDDDVQVFTVHPLPVLAAADTSYCNTPGTVTLPFATPTGGTWAGMGVSGNQFDPQGAGGVGNYQATYTFTDSHDCTNSVEIEIGVVNPAAVAAGPDTSFCASVTSYNLNQFASPTPGTWVGAGLSGNGIFNPSQAGAGTHKLKFSVGTGNCKVTDSLFITVHALPVANAGVDQSACVDVASVALSGSPAGGIWTVSAGGVLNGNAFEPANSGAGSFELTYAVTNAQGCSDDDVQIFTVHPLPVLAAADTSYCNTPGTVTLPFATPSGGTWSGQGITGNQFDPQGAGGVGNYQATYTFTDPHGCTDNVGVEILVVEPVAVEAGQNDTLCTNDGLTQLLGHSPSGGVWSGAGIVDAAAGIFNPALFLAGGTFWVVYSVGEGNCKVSDSLQILVIPNPVIVGNDQEVCLADAAFQLTGFSPPGGSWSGLGVDPQGIFDPSVAGVGSHELTYSLPMPGFGCTFSNSKTVVVHPMPESKFQVAAEACIGVGVAFTNLSQSTWEVFWEFGDSGTSSQIHPVHVYSQAGTYEIILTTTNEFGCTDAFTQSIFVTQPPTLNFAADVTEGCAILEVKFTNLSFGYQASYFWNFGNGQTSNEQHPGSIFFDQGTGDTTYFVTLTAANQCSTLVQTLPITVFPLPIVRFGVSQDTACSPMPVSFSNISLGNPETFFWDFGNGSTSTDSLPGTQTYHTDTSFATYVITLISENFCGSDTARDTIVVKPANVSAFFNLPNAVGCQPFQVQFTNYATPGASIFWDFGDGNTSAMPNPTHVFEQADTFEVIQFATTGCGYDSVTATVTVLPAPEIVLTHQPGVCRGDSIQFFNASPATLSETKWLFGDGDSSFFTNPFHVYEQAGTFAVTLRGVSFLNGCPAEKTGEVTVWELPGIDFQPSPPAGCVPLKVNFANQSASSATYFTWDFGDGNTSAVSQPTHVYGDTGSYLVVLKGTDSLGCSARDTFWFVQVYPVPTADFSMERDRLCGVPVLATLTNSSLGAEGYAWNFGDGGTSTLVHPAHEYSSQGYFQITLIAANSYQCFDTLSQPFTAYPIPVADFEAQPGLGCEPLAVIFPNFSTGSNTFRWEFGDGATSQAAEPTHVYLAEGTYPVRLMVSFDDVCFDTLELETAVEVLPSPFANFEFAEENQGVPTGTIRFTNLSEDAESYFWDFGDGDTSHAENPVHRYYENGIWQVYLEATAANGCTDDTLLQVTPDFFRGLFIPNAFSPEQGLGEVRLFLPKGVGLKEYWIEIFSSYGQLVWRSDRLEKGSPAEAWDGTLNGQLQPQDVYVWKAFGIFEDGTSWQGMPDGEGEGRTIGTLILLR